MLLKDNCFAKKNSTYDPFHITAHMMDQTLLSGQWADNVYLLIKSTHSVRLKDYPLGMTDPNYSDGGHGIMQMSPNYIDWPPMSF